MRRRRASAASSVSRRGLRSSLRLLLCPPSLPSSHFPSSGVYRPRSVLLQEQRSTPRRRRQRHPRLRRLPAPGPRRRWLQGDRLAHPGGLGPAPLRRLRAQARLLHSCPRRVSGGALGEGARLLVPGWGWERGDRNTTELPRSPSGPRMAASGGGETARPLRKHKDGGFILWSWPEARLPAPPAHSHTSSGEQYPACGLRGFGPRASLA